MDSDRSPDVVADPHRREREHLDNARSSDRGPAGRPIDPWGSPHGQLADVLVSELLMTRGPHPPNLEAENEFLHSLAQLLLTDPEHILERSVRAAARLCDAGFAGMSLLETDHGEEVFRWVALGGTFEGQEGRSTPRFFSPCGLAFDRQAPQLFSYPARYYTYLRDAVPEIVEALVLPLPDGTGTIWIGTRDEAIRFDSEHVRLLTGLATFMATSLRLLRLTHQVQRARDETERDPTPQHGGTVAAAAPGTVEGAFEMPLPLPLRVDPVQRGAADVPTPTLVKKKAGNDLVEARGLARAEQQRGIPLVARRTEMSEVLLAYRALVEQVRLVVRDGRRLIRRLIAVCETSKRSRVQMTSSPTPLASVPLVVLRSTTEREQIELNDLVQSLSAEGHQVVGCGPQWVVYTEITDRRKLLTGDSPQSSRGIAAISAHVQRGSIRQRRRSDGEIASAAPLVPTVLIVDDDPPTVEIFAEVLRLEGFQVRTALSTESGMRAVQASRPDVILLDLNMPLANGVEFLRRLRADEWHRGTPVAIVTGDSLDDTVASELHQLGANVAFKPLLSAELVALTRRLLARRVSIH
jgi:CheY-like chemotaxis protein